VGEDPPLVFVSINRLEDGRLKDTAANILARREFVVHLTDEARWRVRLQDYHPVGRFGASFYVGSAQRFAMDEGGGEAAGGRSTAIDEM
jgi:hypothetical protein